MFSIRETVASLCGSMISWALSNFTGIGEKIVRAASLSGGSEGTMLNSLWTTISSLMTGVINSLIPVGLAICVLFFVISLIELAMSERFTLEYFIKYLSKLVIGVVAVYYSAEIFTTFQNFGDDLATYLASIGFYSEVPSADDIKDQLISQFSTFIGSYGAGQWLMLLLAFLMVVPIMGLVGVVITVVAYVVCYSRVLELCVRGAFLPIACALLSDDGWRGAGGRYIRKFIAICAQGSVLVMIGNIASGLIGMASQSMIDEIISFSLGTDMSSVMDLLGKLCSGFALIIGVGFACVALMFKSIGIVNDVFGG